MGWQYRCPRCGKTSHSEQDAKHGYCGACHDFTRIKFTNTGCVAVGCGRPVSERMVLCDDHWAATPRDLQKEFYRARYKYEQGFEGGEVLVRDTIQKMTEVLRG
jgi:hypothetical protein